MYKYNVSLHLDKIDKLEKYNKLFPKKNKEKFENQLVSEIYNSLFTEGEMSSKRDIKKSILSQKENTGRSNSILVQNQISAYNYVFGIKEISINTFSTIYSILTTNIDMKDNVIEEGFLYRQTDVTIGGNNIGSKPYYGIAADKIIEELKKLITYINSDENIIIKAIVAHFIFEIIHPFYDFNGRTGRFIPQIINKISSTKINALDYFSTAIGTYREQYIACFKKAITINTNNKYEPKLDIDKFISLILDLLLLNQYQYKYINDIEQECLNINKSLNVIEKGIILELIRKYEIQQNTDAWCKADFMKEVELNLKQPQFSRSLKKLVELGVIEKTDTVPVRIRLLKKYNLMEKK